MAARISKMYKDSGGCKPKYLCGNCRYYIQSKERPKEHICKKHGEDPSSWKDSWMACRFFMNPIKKQAAKLTEETNGQMQLVLSTGETNGKRTRKQHRVGTGRRTSDSPVPEQPIPVKDTKTSRKVSGRSSDRGTEPRRKRTRTVPVEVGKDKQPAKGNVRTTKTSRIRKDESLTRKEAIS